MSETVVTVDRQIAAPAGEVWAMVSDPTRMGEWSPENAGAKWIGGASGPVVGAKFKGKNKNGWRSWSTVAEVVECEPEKAFAFDVTVGPWKVARWSYRVEPTAAGCKVTEQWDDGRKPFMHKLGWVASGVADRATYNRQSMEQTLDAIARAAEAD